MWELREEAPGRLGQVVMLIQLSADYDEFKQRLERFLPVHTPQLPLALDQPGPFEGDDEDL
jgi:hypothetical protein